MRIPFLSMFMTSPFDGLEEHAGKVKSCAMTFKKAIECHLSDDHEQYDGLIKEVIQLEREADAIKRRIRGHLPKGTLMPIDKFETACAEVEEGSGKPIYQTDPDKCCTLLKVDPTKEAVKDLDAWVCGLRNTEGRTRKDYKEVEHRGLVKINPILTWTEEEVLDYLKENEIDLHPWYSKVFPDGRRIRSLGCEPCTVPISDDQETHL